MEEHVWTTDHIPVSKPPIGIMPRKYHRQQRLVSIIRAIGRYIDAEKSIPQEWWEELEELAEFAPQREEQSDE